MPLFVVTSCDHVGSQRFGGIYCLCLQGWSDRTSSRCSEVDPVTEQAEAGPVVDYLSSIRLDVSPKLHFRRSTGSVAAWLSSYAGISQTYSVLQPWRWRRCVPSELWDLCTSPQRYCPDDQHRHIHVLGASDLIHATVSTRVRRISPVSFYSV